MAELPGLIEDRIIFLPTTARRGKVSHNSFLCSLADVEVRFSESNFLKNLDSCI
jgi:hypothetical protein